MQQINNTKIISGLLLIACILQACHTAKVSNSAANHQLMCYVCENCAKVTKQTPLEACDAAYFDKDSTTEAPVTDPTTSTTTLAEMTTDTMTTELRTTTTAETTTPGSTSEAIPTAPTVGPPPTTTAVPTPPNVSTTIAPLAEVEQAVDAINATTTTTTTTISDSTDSAANLTSNDATPQALKLIVDDYTYHCYSVQKKVNGTVSMERGCSRVTTTESVCGHLKALNNGTQLSKCVPCSNSSCNGSSALAVSVAALVFTLIAALLSRQ